MGGSSSKEDDITDPCDAEHSEGTTKHGEDEHEATTHHEKHETTEKHHETEEHHETTHGETQEPELKLRSKKFKLAEEKGSHTEKHEEKKEEFHSKNFVEDKCAEDHVWCEDYFECRPDKDKDIAEVFPEAKKNFKELYEKEVEMLHNECKGKEDPDCYEKAKEKYLIKAPYIHYGEELAKGDRARAGQESSKGILAVVGVMVVVVLIVLGIVFYFCFCAGGSRRSRKSSKKSKGGKSSKSFKSSKSKGGSSKKMTSGKSGKSKSVKSAKSGKAGKSSGGKSSKKSAFKGKSSKNSSKK